MSRKINIITDENGKKVVVIDEIIFTNKQDIPWDEVEKYLARYVGQVYEVLETGDCIYIGSDLPDEYANSKYSENLKGARAKAKANAVQGIPELIVHATGRKYKKNLSEKHRYDAKQGWYSYKVEFALPIYDNELKTEKYNRFSAKLLVRHAHSGKKYLYDMIDIKKTKK